MGADALLATGHEAAAHGGDVTSMVLVPALASRVKIPIIAAGGIADGRGLMAALSLGAEGAPVSCHFCCLCCLSLGGWQESVASGGECSCDRVSLLACLDDLCHKVTSIMCSKPVWLGNYHEHCLPPSLPHAPSPHPLTPFSFPAVPGVAMGTRLATSTESPLALPTKTAIVKSKEDETIYR